MKFVIEQFQAEGKSSVDLGLVPLYEIEDKVFARAGCCMSRQLPAVVHLPDITTNSRMEITGQPEYAHSRWDLEWSPCALAADSERASVGRGRYAPVCYLCLADQQIRGKCIP